MVASPPATRARKRLRLPGGAAEPVRVGRLGAGWEAHATAREEAVRS